MQNKDGAHNIFLQEATVYRKDAISRVHVETYVESMQRHIHMHKKPTYPNIEHVEKITYPTWKQTHKNNANAKHNTAQTQTRGRLKTPTSQKERKVVPFVGDRE